MNIVAESSRVMALVRPMQQHETIRMGLCLSVDGDYSTLCPTYSGEGMNLWCGDQGGKN